MARTTVTSIRQVASALRVLMLAALCLSVVPGVARSKPANPKTISIAEARSLPLGTIVTIDGSVTVPSGAFTSSAFDQGFAIQDHTGGIYVGTPDNLGLAPRQQVRVTGRLVDSFGSLFLVDETDVKVHGAGPKVQALPVATGDVGEATEGKLVRIRATIVEPVIDNLPYGFQVVVDDGSGEVRVFIATSTGIDVSGLSPGQTIEVTGLSAEFGGTYEVDPRFPSDLKILP